MRKEINFDMDGTIADLYGVENWLYYLRTEKTKPYREAKPLVNMHQFGKELARLKQNGYKINIISWLPKGGSKEYNEKVAKTKIEWLRRHCGSVKFDKIVITEYGEPKENHGKGILFDDKEEIRNQWNGDAYAETDLIDTLRAIA